MCYRLPEEYTLVYLLFNSNDFLSYHQIPLIYVGARNTTINPCILMLFRAQLMRTPINRRKHLMSSDIQIL